MKNEDLKIEYETEFLVSSFQCSVVSGNRQKEAPLPGPPPATASRGAGNDYAAGGGAGAAAVGNLKFQISDGNPPHHMGGYESAETGKNPDGKLGEVGKSYIKLPEVGSQRFF